MNIFGSRNHAPGESFVDQGLAPSRRSWTLKHRWKKGSGGVRDEKDDEEVIRWRSVKKKKRKRKDDGGYELGDLLGRKEARHY